MYSEVFCKVYNEFGWNYYPEAFGEELLRWIRESGAQIHSAMDLGCGTGILCDILDRSGVRASGADLSESMIAVAKDNFPHLEFAVADMITYRPMQHFDLVTCTGDALNHILSLQDVQTIFYNVFSYLEPGGYFIFDILNEAEVSPCEPFDCPFSDSIRAEFQILKDSSGQINLKTRVFEDGQFRFEENIYEILHDPAVIRELLEKAGFGKIRISDRLTEAGNKSTTWYVIARKPE